MARFKDRREAGQLFAQKLSNYANDRNLIVVALPRGGVPVGFEVAKALNAPLDILVVRKLGMPNDNGTRFSVKLPTTRFTSFTKNQGS